MTSISSTATQAYTPQSTSHAHSGRHRLSDAIQQQEQSGALSSTDATALTSALSSIDSSLQGDSSSNTSATSTSGTSSGNKLDPSSIKDRIDSLISDQESSGALTSGQASELKNLFASHGQSVTSSGSSSDADGDGPDGPPPGPPPVGGVSGTSSSSASSSTSSSTGTSASDLLNTFIQQVQAAQSNSASYAASGQTASTQSSALLFDFNS